MSDKTYKMQNFAFGLDHSVGQWKWDTSQLIGEILTKTARWDAVSWFWALVGVPSNGGNRVIPPCLVAFKYYVPAGSYQVP